MVGVTIGQSAIVMRNGTPLDAVRLFTGQRASACTFQHKELSRAAGVPFRVAIALQMARQR